MYYLELQGLTMPETLRRDELATPPKDPNYQNRPYIEPKVYCSSHFKVHIRAENSPERSPAPQKAMTGTRATVVRILLLSWNTHSSMEPWIECFGKQQLGNPCHTVRILASSGSFQMSFQASPRASSRMLI